MGADRDAGAARGPSGVARRAIRTTLAACAGFFLFLYGLDQSVAAMYALFSVVSMAALSHIPGTGRQRAAVVVRTTPVAWVLVTIGTYLAVRTWSAVAGMLVIGFFLAFVAVAGPRASGAAPGLQLLYILPCFPPYAPDTLGQRLLGTTCGLALLILAELFVLPEPRGPSYRQRAAEAADTAARCAGELGRAPYTLSAAGAQAARAAGESLRPFRVPEADRPAGPGLRDRGLAHAGLAARTLLNRMVNLPAPPPERPPPQQAPGVPAAVGAAAAECAALLRGTGGSTDEAGALRGVRERAVEVDEQPASEALGVRRAALLEVADAAVAFTTAAELAVRGRRARLPAETDAGRFWYAGRRAPHLWWHRLAAHAGPRSVHFQNAVRLSLALAAARTIAGIDSLPHGFWAMLAVLSLTRTTVSQTRATVRLALAGTLLGALATGCLLALIGGNSTVYAIALPFVMFVAFRVGPVRGVGWAQGMFTLVVSFAFAQLAPVTWRLAEIRILDVAIGSMIGVVFGLLAWPRGAQAELHRAVAELLAEAADAVESTAAAVAAGGPGRVPDDEPLQRALLLAESAFSQRQSEPQAPVGFPADLQAALMTGHHVLWGSRRLHARGGPPLEPSQQSRLRARGAQVATGLRATSSLASATSPPVPTGKDQAGGRDRPAATDLPAGTHRPVATNGPTAANPPMDGPSTPAPAPGPAPGPEPAATPGPAAPGAAGAPPAPAPAPAPGPDPAPAPGPAAAPGGASAPGPAHASGSEPALPPAPAPASGPESGSAPGSAPAPGPASAPAPGPVVGVALPRFYAGLAWLDSLNTDVERISAPTGGSGGPDGTTA
ncbi:FUSC family protein [Streptomyces sp. NPDC091273]|uniref:FUSC family protein n=1 Tax=Streptomyces sp. NPDC091273 TaxID=3365982 RepID=UPI0037FD6522